MDIAHQTYHRFHTGARQMCNNREPNTARYPESLQNPTQSEALDRSVLSLAREALVCEANALRDAADRLDDKLVRAVEAILAAPGKVVVTGLGKSGHVARKL